MLKICWLRKVGKNHCRSRTGFGGKRVWKLDQPKYTPGRDNTMHLLTKFAVGGDHMDLLTA